MSTEPVIEQRTDQPYAAVTSRVTMQELGTVLPPLMSQVFEWLGTRGIAPDGPPFWKYNLVDMDRELEVEVGVPVAAATPDTAGDPVHGGVLPAGRYATLRHTGHPSELMAATGALLDWARREGLAWDVVDAADGQRWTARVEFYLTDPAEEPNMDKWETELAFRLSD